MKKLRTYLKKIREDKNLTQVQLAEKIGISQNYYSQIENGLRQESIKLELLQKLSEALDVTLDLLIREEMKFKISE